MTDWFRGYDLYRIGNSDKRRYMNYVTLLRGKEAYIFRFDDKSWEETIRTFGRYASDPELSFTWRDAALLSKGIREKAEGKEFCLSIGEVICELMGKKRF